MTARPQIYNLAQIRDYDHLKGWLYGLIGKAEAMQFLLGTTTTLVQGAAAGFDGSPDMNINIGAGFLASYSAVDQQTYGDLAPNTKQIMHLGVINAQTLTPVTTGMTSGQQQYVLVQAAYAEVNQIAVDDPDGGVLAYINLQNPQVAWYGPNNTFNQQNTVRLEGSTVSLLYGTAAAAGSATIPAPSAGFVPLYAILLSSTTTSITAAPVAPNAPFFNGILGHHHSGGPGQGPQVNLTAGSTQEVTGNLPVVNMVASNIVGAVAAWRNCAGNPNGQLAGFANVNGASDQAFDITNNVLYVCTTTGSSSTAVWTSVNPAAVGNPFNKINLIKILANGTYTPSSGMKYCQVEVMGGGGGGGGGTYTVGTGNAIGAGGGGGGSGGRIQAILTAAQIGSSASVVIGNGGSGGAAATSTFANGSQGATIAARSIFTAAGTGSAILTAGFGGQANPGISSSGGTLVDFEGTGSISGYGGSVSGTGFTYLLLKGQGGSSGHFGAGGAGGSNAYGGGGAGGDYEGLFSYTYAGITVDNHDGQSGDIFGGGGGGGAAGSITGGSYAAIPPGSGGAGGQGGVIIYEFCQV